MGRLLDYLRENAVWLSTGFLLTFMSSFGQTFLIAVFAADIRADFGLSHGGWGGIYAIGTMAAALAMMAAGGLTDRFRVRHLGLAILLGLGAAAAFLPFAGGLATLTLAVFFLRFFGQGMMGHTAMVAMSRWFAATRGRAVSIAGLGFSVGEAVLPLAMVALLGLFEWRTVWFGIALFLALVAPVLYAMLRHERTPQSFASSPGRAGMEGRHWTRGEALRHPLFWALVPVLVGLSAWNTAFFFHQVHLAVAKGLTHAQFVALFPLYSLVSVAFMLLAGWLCDRIGVARIATVALVPVVAGYLVLAGAPVGSVGAIGAALALVGATVGMNSTLMGALWAEFYGTAHVGAIRSATAFAMVGGSAIGPVVTGALIDRGIAFPAQALAIALYFAMAGGLMAAVVIASARSLPPREAVE